MGFLSFCIIACFLSSCNTDDNSDFGLEPSGRLPEGEKIVVNFTVEDITFGESIPVTRKFTNPADGFYYAPFQGKDGVNTGESTVFVPMEDDIYMYASLREKEEDSSIKLRVNVPIAPNIKVRVVAYTGPAPGYSIFAGYADYYATTTIVNGTQTVLTHDPSTPALTATLGMNYKFVAYSLNSESPLMPFSNTHDISSGDLLWGETYVTIPSAGISSNVHINMKHLFAKVELKVQATAVDGTVFLFDNIGLTSASVQGYNANLRVRDGQLTPSVSDPNLRQFPVSWTSLSSPSIELTSNPVYLFTNGVIPSRVRIGSITLDDSNPTYVGPYTAAYNTTLQPGRSYIFEIHLKRDDAPPGTLAGSNIYWDGTKLTFDPAGVFIRQQYQGVYFKWGSLVGVGIPAGGPAFNSNYQTMPRYVPSYDASNPYLSEWTIMTTVGLIRWADIPAYYGTGYAVPTAQRGSGRLFLSEFVPPTFYVIQRGDICKYLGETGAGPKGYRLPASLEFTQVMSWATRNSTAMPAWGTLNNSGTGIIQRGWSDIVSGNFLPNSMSRSTSGGTNSYARYATSSASSNTASSYHFRIYYGNSGTRALNRSASRNYGYVVRCIKEGGIIPGIDLYPITVDQNEWDDDGDMYYDLELDD